MAENVAMAEIGSTSLQVGQLSEGPSGGRSGGDFVDTCTSGEFITEMIMRSGNTVDSLQFATNLGLHAAHGGSGGREARFRIAPGEFLTKVQGRYGNQIDRIEFTTNRGTSAAFGGTGGSRNFSFEAPTGFEICGFIGASGSLVDATGVILRAKT